MLYAFVSVYVPAESRESPLFASYRCLVRSWWKRLAIWESCDSDVSTSIVLLVSRWCYGTPALAISDDMVRSSLFPATGFSNITI